MPSDLECVQTYLRRQARRGRIAQALAAFTVYNRPQITPRTHRTLPRRLRRIVRDADLGELIAMFGDRARVLESSSSPASIPTCQSAWRQ